MSLVFTHASENQIKAPCLLATGETPWRGLPRPWPLSATWACYPLNLINDYYDLLTFGPDPYSGADYYMAATVNIAGGPKWNLGLDGDHVGPTIVSNQWYYQGLRFFKNDVTGDIEGHYHYDLATGGVIDFSENSPNFFNAPSATHALVTADAAWAVGTAGTENWNGYLQGLKIWQAFLSPAELWAEAQSLWPVLPKYFAALWAVLPMRMANDYSIPGQDARNKRHWGVPSVTNFPVSGGPAAPLQSRGLIWYLGDVFSSPGIIAASTDMIPRSIEIGQSVSRAGYW